MEGNDAGFPPSLEIPSGFPHSRGPGDWIYVFSCPLNSNHRHRKGLVTDVSGPQRNACPGTLRSLSVIAVLELETDCLLLEPGDPAQRQVFCSSIQRKFCF
jgi:hypothetical protein